ncbi:family 20 glycosylhydrolase [Sphingomonas sp. GC_Shp_6]|uniref:beta-N-acetylhexosaminidase n=1 Tax=Sphingomonas sp. GC_Shp_6 TaxID=2937378 RepID=UPI00226A179A|nr:family 20 glycosylhydrolase [Sphingomonas sp. GC_Shp_6]
MPVRFRLALAALALPSAAIAADPLPLVPLPAAITPAAGGFTIAAGQRVAAAAGDTGAANAARLFVEQMQAQRGLALVPASGDAPIRFVRDAGIGGAEAYRLTVTPAGITVAASGDAGLIWGAMTLAQLASPDAAIGRPVTIGAVTIADAPRFAWRGLMIDVARHFQPIGVLRDIVDQMAAVKLNTLHIHLTDDQGWRVEIRKYPRLTTIGGWRTPPSTGGAPGAPVGGFYTQAELRGLVAYARAHGIMIVPEVDLPGHAQALVAAYPELGVAGDRPAVGHDWGVNPYLFDPGPKGIAFVKDVLDELMAIFPGTYIHLGGDEAVKDQWERSPTVQAQIKALGLKDEDGLQSWMIEQFGRYLEAKGRRLIGWDEILEGGLPPSASVMSWRGEKGAVDAANQGHDVVLSPDGPLYLDHLQSDRTDEPPGRFGIYTLAAVYAYDPMPPGIAGAGAAHVLGAQGNAWSELLVTPAEVQHKLFPRAAALAEITWSPKAARDWAGFLPRVHRQGERWTRAGMTVADSAFAVGFTLVGTPGDALRKNVVPVTLATQSGYGTIRYTVDGSVPSATSAAYASTIPLRPGAVLRAAAFDAAGAATATPRRFDAGRAALLSRSSAELTACPAGAIGMRVPLAADATASAPAYAINLFDTCTRYPDAPLDIATGYRVEIARLPRNYGLAHDASALRAHYAVTAHGELLVQVGCAAAAKARAAGDKTARPVAAGLFALPDPTTAPQRFAFAGTLPRMAKDADICFQFTSPLSDPFYTVERVQLVEGRR